ncbi:MAG: saccharopine dehydrogenase NADP-binding domain-containing protein [Actinomycetia bacterium]|nr:saccharopine dehydrogenase NADP-binding domain-containing protein [Actinomycetes bacterium]
METLVLGSGIVGAAAAWDLVRRGHAVTVADANVEAVEQLGSRVGAGAVTVDVTNNTELTALLEATDIVVSAVPYRYGAAIAAAAIDTDTHYLDFGGNPTVVASQRKLDDGARARGLMVVPDCGLAPGLANVLAQDLIDSADTFPIESIQMRVGALPQVPRGTLAYQLAFSAHGLINEYAEPCEVLEGGAYSTVEPLTRFENVDWERWGPLEAFSTAGGTSTMCERNLGRVTDLEYKTLRFPGHGSIFSAMREIGLFDESPRDFASQRVAPRSVLIDTLITNLPRDEPDLVLIRVWRSDRNAIVGYQIEDTATDGISALARTTAFPATALADLISRGEVRRPGVLSMGDAVLASELMPELSAVGIEPVAL